MPGAHTYPLSCSSVTRSRVVAHPCFVLGGLGCIGDGGDNDADDDDADDGVDEYDDDDDDNNRIEYSKTMLLLVYIHGAYVYRQSGNDYGGKYLTAYVSRVFCFVASLLRITPPGALISG